MNIDIVLKHGAKTPEYKSGEAGALDCYAHLEENSAGIQIEPHACAVVPLGFAVAIPTGFVGRLLGRSGLASKNIRVHPGLIDSDYRGEVCAVVYNDSNADLLIEQHDRICQFYVAQKHYIEWNVVDKLDDTERGAGGFGHTGGY